jgi:hypothetical protein
MDRGEVTQHGAGMSEEGGMQVAPRSAMRPCLSLGMSQSWRKRGGSVEGFGGGPLALPRSLRGAARHLEAVIEQP